MPGRGHKGSGLCTAVPELSRPAPSRGHDELRPNGVLRSSRQSADGGTMRLVERLTRHWKKRVRKEEA